MKSPKPDASPQEVAKVADTPAPAPVETPTATDAPTPQPADKPGPSVVVIGPPQGRWRIGRKFGAEPVTIPLSELSKDEMDRLGADPLLVCQVVSPPY